MSDLWWPKFLRKPRLRLSTPQIRGIQMPSKWIFFGLVMLVYFFVVSGSIHSISYNALPLIATEAGPQLLYPGLHRQFQIEGFVGGTLFFVGFLGFYFTYQSTRHIYRPRYAQMMLAIGWVLIIFSFIGCSYLMWWKQYGYQLT